jgi:hypothetical protein
MTRSFCVTWFIFSITFFVSGLTPYYYFLLGIGSLGIGYMFLSKEISKNNQILLRN